MKDDFIKCNNNKNNNNPKSVHTEKRWISMHCADVAGSRKRIETTQPTTMTMIRCLNVKVIYFQKNNFILLIICCVHTLSLSFGHMHRTWKGQRSKLLLPQSVARSLFLSHMMWWGITHTFENDTLSINDKMLRASFKSVGSHTRNTSGSGNKQREIAFRCLMLNYFPNRDEIWAALFISIIDFHFYSALCRNQAFSEWKWFEYHQFTYQGK